MAASDSIADSSDKRRVTDTRRQVGDRNLYKVTWGTPRTKGRLSEAEGSAVKVRKSFQRLQPRF